jgi:RNA polymerase sigma factor (sigma-70 family)
MSIGQLAVVVRQIHRLADSGGHEGLTDGQLLERFLGGGDELAFAALVRRHGPLVLGVCRRVLRDRHAAEDAFQATFLILLRRARSLDRRGSVASWLYTVAYHVALRARADAARRPPPARPVPQPPEAGWADLQPVLDEELGRLPESYRSVVVLCYLEGKTNVEAARLLGWPVGTVKGRLARARDLLRARLTRRGITLSAGLVGASLAESATAAVPAALLRTTLRTALPTAATAAPGGGAVSTAVTLAEGALRTMATTKLKTAAALLLLGGLVAFGLVGGTHPAQAQKQTVTGPAAGDSMPKMPAKLPAGTAARPGAKAEDLTVAGRVLGPDGKALAGAKVAVIGWRPRWGGAPPRALAQGVTDAAGKFSLKVRRPPGFEAVTVASAPGCGLGWHWPDGKTEAEIRLRPEQVLRGRLIDLQGQPAAGVKLEVTRLGSRPPRPGGDYVLVESFLDRDADGWPDVWVAGDGVLYVWGDTGKLVARSGVVRWDARRGGAQVLALPEVPAGLPAWPGAVTTDAQGRFVVRGVPQGMGVGLRVRDPRFALQVVDVPPPEKGKAGEVTRVLGPVRVLEGTITDAATGKPVPNARVRVHAPGTGTGASVVFDVSGSMSGADARGRRGLGDSTSLAFVAEVALAQGIPVDEIPPLEAQADAKGRFRLTLFRAGSYTLLVGAPGEPYLLRTVQVTWPQEAVVRKEVNLTLVRGVHVRGRVTEAPGGKAVAAARVDFWSKGLKLPEGVRHPRAVQTGPDGTFRALLPTGPWHLLVNGPEPVYRYQPIAIDRLTEEGGKPQGFQVRKDGSVRPAVPEGTGRFYPDAWVPLELKPGPAREVAVTLRRAPLLRGRVVGPDGKPLARVLGVRRPALPAESAAFLDKFTRRLFLDLTGKVPTVAHMALMSAGQPSGSPLAPVELRDGAFSIPVLDPKATYPVHFFDPDRKLGAFVELKGEQAGKDPVTVRLSPCGSARARFVDAGGKALAGYRPSLWLLLPPGPHPVPRNVAEVVKGRMHLGDALWAAGLDPARYGAGPRTDARGRVTLPALIPGATYRLLLADGKARDFTVRAGETLDLADLTSAEPAAAARLPVVQPPKGP